MRASREYKFFETTGPFRALARSGRAIAAPAVSIAGRLSPAVGSEQSGPAPDRGEERPTRFLCRLGLCLRFDHCARSPHESLGYLAEAGRTSRRLGTDRRIETATSLQAAEYDRS